MLLYAKNFPYLTVFFENAKFNSLLKLYKALPVYASAGLFFIFGGIMPETKFEYVVFTAVTAFIMVYIMTLYNTALASHSFVNFTFLVALKTMWLEFIVIGLCAFFISSPLAKHFAFKVVQKTDRPIFIIFAIQIFTVVFQVGLASIIGVWHGYGFTKNFIPDYMTTYCRNFLMAMPVQLFLAGPLARKIFRSIFRRNVR